MLLQLQRDHYLPNSTLGMLSVQGVLRAYTLERPVDRYPADFHCIPAGTYSITLYDSPHFKRVMPLLENVPGHSDIEIHWGNYPWDGKGCILVGFPRNVISGEVWNSKSTFDGLYPSIEEAFHNEGCQIEITDGE